MSIKSPASFMRILPFVFLATAILNSGCRTLWGGGDETPTESKDTVVEKKDGSLFFSEGASQKLYLKMLSIELTAGVKVAKDQLHTARAAIQCHKDGVLESCFFRVRLPEDELSSAQTLGKENSKKTIDYIRSDRIELGNEKLVMADLVCDYIGKKSPPYNIERVSCKVVSPRNSSEAVFTDKIASELSEALRGEVKFGTKVITVSGSLACHWVDKSKRRVCMVRPVVKGVLLEKVIEVSSRNSIPIANQLQRSLKDLTKLRSAGNPKPFIAPKEIMGALTCIIDSTKTDSAGRFYTCRVSL